MKLDCTPYETKMKKSIDSYAYTLSTMRAGRASADVLSPIKFEYYGSPTPISQMAEIKATDARTLVIQPWDGSTLKTIEKAILASNIGITPMNDGKTLRLPIPELSQERRSALAKQAKSETEDAKVALRNIRRDGNESAKKGEKDGALTEDDLKKMLDDIQKMTDRYIASLDAMLAAKEKELMTM